MIEFTRGDITKADAEALVNTVNCVGVMGRGIALQFKKSFPGNFRIYEEACRRGDVEPGRVLVTATGQLTNPRFIINVPTKRHWRGKSRLADVEAGLKDLIREIEERGIRSVAIPPLGCGLGGLDWNDVRPRIEAAIATVPTVEALVFEPAGSPSPTQMTKAQEVPAMTGARAALVRLIDRYLGGSMDTSVSLLEVHKLLYFMQEAGHPMKLRYVKAPYGPYAENLRFLLHRIEGYYITGYADGGDDPKKIIELVPGAGRDAAEFLDIDIAAREGFERVSDLVEGFETPFGLELLASVHWVATREDITDADHAIAAMYAWNDRKQRFKPAQIRLAWTILADKGWLRAPAAP